MEGTPERAEALADQIDQGLRAAGDPARAAAERPYLKSDLAFLGTGVPATRAVVRAALKAAHPPLDRQTVLGVADLLWTAPVHERRLAAVELLAASLATLEPADVALVERLIREARTWALVDPLASEVTGGLLRYHPVLCATLDCWAGDADFWVRRAAMLALLPALRQGGGDFARFAGYAEGMLEEREFFIRKAIGWVLREVAKQRPELVVEWLLPRAHRASGVTVREAVKYLPPADREAVLHAWHSGAVGLKQQPG